MIDIKYEFNTLIKEAIKNLDLDVGYLSCEIDPQEYDIRALKDYDTFMTT